MSDALREAIHGLMPRARSDLAELVAFKSVADPKQFPFAEAYPEAEIFLMGVEEPKCLIHAPNESVDPSEIEHLALAEALFLEKYAETKR
jgi:hypothetical protein